MASVLITGCNRGLGLEWVRQLAADGWRIYATCRYPEQADELNGLAREHPSVSVHRLDVTRPEQVTELASNLVDAPIDILINNAGVYLERTKSHGLGSLRYEDWVETLAVNTLGPVRVTEAFVEQVARSERRLVVAITSHMGSIADIESAGSYYYRSSKAALNAAMKGLALELERQGIGVLLLHPGWVRTRMGGRDAPITPETSVSGMRAIVESFRVVDSGRFLRYDGGQMPW